MHCCKNGESFLKKPSAGLSEACHGGVQLSSVPVVVTHVIERPFSLSLSVFLAMRLLSSFCLCCKSETIKNGDLVIFFFFFFWLAMRLLSLFCLCYKSKTIKSGNLVILFCFLFFKFKMCPFHFCARCIRNKCTEKKYSSLNM